MTDDQGCSAFIVVVATIAAIIYIIAHFLIKYW